MQKARVLKPLYKVSAFDWRNKIWVVKQCSIPTRKKAKEIVAGLFRDGYLARWSKHFGGEYNYYD